MSREVIEEVAEIARQLQEQLKFYREIGITDLGRDSQAARAASFTAASFTAEPRRELLQTTDEAGKEELPEATFQIRDDQAMPKKSSSVGQASLFGDIADDAEGKAATQAGSRLSPQDASLEAIREDLGECIRCKLHQHRTHIVFGEGNPQAKIMFVGEGPGADEDATGRPFVGRAGQLLEKIIAAIGLKREDVYITNVVKCRPPQNRTPERDEVATCEQFLFRQIARIRPQVIVALGSPAFQCLLRTKETITKARGDWRDLEGIKVMPTFHPAYLLRSPEKKREAWEDMKKVRDFLNTLPG